MVTVESKEFEKVISGPKREAPENPDEIPDEGVTFEPKKENDYKRRKEVSKNKTTIYN